MTDADLDALKGSWARYDHKLDETLRLNRRLLTERSLDRARSALQRLAAGIALEAGCTAAVVVALGAYVGAHLREPALAVPAAVLGACAVAVLVSLIRQIALAAEIRPGERVTAMQARVEQLRILKIRTTQVALFTAPLVWPPLMMVSANVVLGIDAYRAFGIAYIAANVAFGTVFLALALWAARTFGPRAGRSPFFQQLLGDIAGRNLRAARDFLAEIGEFTATA